MILQVCRERARSVINQLYGHVVYLSRQVLCDIWQSVLHVYNTTKHEREVCRHRLCYHVFRDLLFLIRFVLFCLFVCLFTSITYVSWFWRKNKYIDCVVSIMPRKGGGQGCIYFIKIYNTQKVLTKLTYTAQTVPKDASL